MHFPGGLTLGQAGQECREPDFKLPQLIATEVSEVALTIRPSVPEVTKLFQWHSSNWEKVSFSRNVDLVMKVPPPFSKYLENFFTSVFWKTVRGALFYLNQMGSLALIE